ncbi:receptor-type tyrosine-protein phosphatase C-like isoform X2 [Neocloeon triangulifer]|uniref:receptor-type tyrosine-protein phosphatase C-like isoform X2 n=1 Tax=Neocloeon triangulifer TaxID=2078957 RepID=UPI00286F0A1C|nr:receptor-type tyrosine-protein phosphatase C-like isoform X2 [Neocloeon triangulifer]
MMKLGKIIFLLVFFTCGSKNGAQGYLIAIKNGQYVEVCLTDEINGSDKDLLDSNGYPLILAGHDCNLVVENGCESWNIEGTYLTPNIQNGYDLYPPVDDFRLIDIPIITNNKDELIRAASFKSSEDARLRFSVLASSSAQFLMSNSEKHEEGYIIVLDGWGDRHRSSIRYCKPFPVTGSGQCEELTNIDNMPLLKNGNVWIPVTLEYRKTQQMVSVNVGNLTSFFQAKITQKDYLNVEAKNYEYAVTLNLAAGIFQGNGKLKFHQYKVLMPSKKFSKIRTSVKNIRGTLPICVDVIFWLSSDEKFIRNKEVFSMTVSRQNSPIFIGNGKFNGKKNEWKKVRFTSENRIQSGDVIELTFLDTKLTIGGIRFCAKDTKGDLNIKPKHDIQSCDIFSPMGTSKSREGSHKKLVEVTSNNKICQYIGFASCVGLKACDGNEECACFPSFSGHFCKNGCAAKKYGWNCSFKSNKSCEGDEINYNGSCSRGCLPGYRRLHCLDRIRQINPELSAIDIGPTKISLDMWKLTKNDSSFSRIAIQIKRNKSESWHTSVDYKNPLVQLVYIDGLEKNTVYNLRLVLYEMDEQFNDKNLKDIQFTTKLCQPIDNRSVEIKVAEPFTVHVRFKADNQTLADPCKLTHLKITRNNSEVAWTEIITNYELKRDIKNLTANAEYQISIFAEDSSVINYTYIPNTALDLRLSKASEIWWPITIGVLVLTGTLLALCAVRNKMKRSNVIPSVSSTHESQTNPDLIENCPQEGPKCNETTPFNSSAIKITEFEQYLESTIDSGTLKQQFEHHPRGQTQSWVVGTKPANKKKNRYANLAAYDSTRIILKHDPHDENADYINANYVDGFQRPNAYIATQGPKTQTVNDFWCMIWQEKVTQIVMVTNIEESGKIKCEKYWPDPGKSKKFAGFSVNNLEEKIHAHFVVRTLSVSYSDKNKLVQQLHFTTWPDHDVPLYPQTMAIFVEKMIQHQSQGPIAVHCSAGVGRTGTVILIHASLLMARKHGFVDVFKIFGQMRSQRANLVDNLKQYEFAHLVLLEAIAFPKLDFPCSEFEAEFAVLMKSNKQKLTESFTKLNEICNNDWKRAEKQVAAVEMEKCRQPQILGSPSRYVRLFPYGSVTKMSFVNAVFVDGYQKEKQFIATQVPMQDTVADFWRMVHQFNVQQIVVLNESHATDGSYIPTEQTSLTFDELKIISVAAEERNNGCLQSIKIHAGQQEEKMVYMHFCKDWNVGALKCPSTETLVELWEEMSRATTSMTLIMCHDGATACGIYLGIGFLLEKMKLEHQVDAALALRTLRKSRPAFISNIVQYEMLFEAARAYLQTFDTYGNFN